MKSSNSTAVLYIAGIIAAFYSVTGFVIILFENLRQSAVEIKPDGIVIPVLLIWFGFFLISALLIWPISAFVDWNKGRGGIKGHLDFNERDLSKSGKDIWKQG